jgi:hypothetical protein
LVYSKPGPKVAHAYSGASASKRPMIAQPNA